jgi:hypothetical protein
MGLLSRLRHVDLPPKEGVMLCFYFFNCAYHTDYHWDRHLYFVILSLMHRLDPLLLTYVTHTTTDTSSIRTMTSSYYSNYLTWWLSKYRY